MQTAKVHGPHDDRIADLLDNPPLRMTEREHEFLEDMLGRLMLTDKQEQWLEDIFAKYEGEGR